MSENAVVYARYSSRGQQEQSIEGQLAAAEAYASRKGYRIIHSYCDRAKTGTNDNRDEFQKMLRDCAKGKFSVIIVWKVDRFGRNREEITFNKYRAKKHGVRVEYVAENISDGPEGVILESLFEGMAEYFSLQLSQNVRRGLLESAKKHHVIGGWTPLGFRAGKDRSYEIDEDQAKIVRMIFEKYAGGMTLFELMRWLNDSGYRTARGKPFAKTSLSRLLQDERYIGTYTFKDVIRDEDAIPAIIDKKTFEEVQNMISTNKRMPSGSWDYSEYLLTGKLFCGKCGQPMVGKSGTGRHGTKYGYYVCSGKLHRKDCDKKAVRQDVIEDLVLSAFHDVLQDDGLLAFIGDKVWALYESEKEEDPAASLRNELKAAEKASASLVRSLELGAVSETLVARLNELEEQKAALKVAIAEKELSVSPLTREMVQFFLEKFRDMDFMDVETRKKMLGTFVNSAFVYDDKATVTFNYADGGNETVTLEDLEKERNTPEGSNVFRLADQVERHANPCIIISLGIFAIDIALSA